MKYNHRKIETKWQRKWEEEAIYQPDLKGAKKPFYNLMMFPYPSAEGLHVGNMYAFTGADIYGRFKRMQGYAVFEPIGLDGFGIHSENYALKIGRHPVEQAKISQENFYRQLRLIGNGFAWKSKLETYDPNYYKWTQWIFVQMFKKGLAYRKKSSVNWCPSCKTVLADEQVERGVCERCKSAVETKELKQWFFRITKYADRLLGNLDKIDWTLRVKEMQRNWIGKKEGINIRYKVVGGSDEVVCFTTRPDTNFGATFIVLGPEHPLVDELTIGKYREEIRRYKKASKAKTALERVDEGVEKTGVFTGSYCINNLNGRKLPVWVSDFVLGDVGTGAVVGVPGHDLRDFQFAKKFGLPVIRVVVGRDGDTSRITREEQVHEEAGTMINSQFLNGLDIHTATKRIMDYIEEKGWGERKVVYHLRDWLISRQRYWGPPIPMIKCGKCGWVAVPEKDLPVELPYVGEWKPLGRGESPLAGVEEWVNVECPSCGGAARRETDVSDTFLDSAWYFLRYPSVGCEKEILDRDLTKKWLPVDMYIGGAEHSVLHLLYSRFLTMVFKDWSLVSFEEPYEKFRAHGLLISEGAKMSKSLGNVINPDEYIKNYGADTVRMYLMFLGRFEQGGDFQDKGIRGMVRFLNKFWRLVEKSKNEEKSEERTLRKLHKVIKKVGEDIEELKYNTAIAALMELVNEWEVGRLSREEAIKAIKLLAPFAPHLAEELYHRFKIQDSRFTNEKFQSVHLQPWPKYDPKLVEEEMIEFVIQVNGKLRATLVVDSRQSTVESAMEKKARESERVQKYLEGKKIEKTIFVPGKLINFVT